jgi:2-polyprenyl-6-methoxyphenol hydroxylase-like FAD-dependent oxidoreductase
MEVVDTDVVIVGASVGGSTAARLFGQAGLRVLLVDRVSDAAAYKKQCTHFIQACATPVFERLGVIDELERAGAVRNALRVFTPAAGWARLAHETERAPDGTRNHGYTIRRSKLDPILRRAAERTPGVELRLGLGVEALLPRGGGLDDGIEGVELSSPSGESVQVRAKLVVGADGRHSRVAELANMPAELSPHGRAGFFAYFEGARVPWGTDAQFWVLGAEVAYSFPSDDGLVCMAVVVPDEGFGAFREDKEGFMRRFVAKLPAAPELASATRVGEFVGVRNTPNHYRWPVQGNLALIGDAALASDYIWGVGCGWAMQSASFLVDQTAKAVARGRGLERALGHYARQHRRALYPQHEVNAAFSAAAELPPVLQQALTAAPQDRRLCELLALQVAGRISPRSPRIPLRLLAGALGRRLRRRPNVVATPATKSV